MSSQWGFIVLIVRAGYSQTWSSKMFYLLQHKLISCVDSWFHSDIDLPHKQLRSHSIILYCKWSYIVWSWICAFVKFNKRKLGNIQSLYQQEMRFSKFIGMLTKKSLFFWHKAFDEACKCFVKRKTSRRSIFIQTQ